MLLRILVRKPRFFHRGLQNRLKINMFNEKLYCFIKIQTDAQVVPLYTEWIEEIRSWPVIFEYPNRFSLLVQEFFYHVTFVRRNPQFATTPSVRAMRLSSWALKTVGRPTAFACVPAIRLPNVVRSIPKVSAASFFLHTRLLRRSRRAWPALYNRGRFWNPEFFRRYEPFWGYTNL